MANKNMVPLQGDFHPRRINQYVPAMTMAADIATPSGIGAVDFGAPAALDADGLLSNANLSTSATTVDVSSLVAAASASVGAIGNVSDAPFGRNVTASTAAASSEFDIYGYDYLGQPMIERLVCSSSVATGLKCFHEVTSIGVAVAGAASTDIGWGARLGLPYKATNVLSEELDGIKATLGTVNSPVLTTGVSTTGDPKGSYSYASTLTGAARLTGTFLFDAQTTYNSTTDTWEGGLHGMPQYAG